MEFLNSKKNPLVDFLAMCCIWPQPQEQGRKCDDKSQQYCEYPFPNRPFQHAQSEAPWGLAWQDRFVSGAPPAQADEEQAQAADEAAVLKGT